MHMEIFRKHTVFKIRKFPACQHAAGMHRVSCLGFQRIPVGGDCRDKNTVARLEIFYIRADFHHFCAAFMPENHVMPFTDSTLPHGMYVGSTDSDSQRLTDGIHSAADRSFFFNPAYRTDFEHCITFHQ